MKQMMYGLLCCLLCVGLAACSSKEEEPEQKEYKLNDVVELKNSTLKVTGINAHDGEGFMKPGEGKRYVSVMLEIENTSKKEISYIIY